MLRSRVIAISAVVLVLVVLLEVLGAAAGRRVDATRLRSRAHTFLYAEATDGLWARFGRRAAMRLAERHLEVAADGFDLVVGGERHPVLELDESGFARVLGSVAPPRARR